MEMEPTGLHEQVSALIGRKLNIEIDRQDLSYFIPHRCLIKLLATEIAFRPSLAITVETLNCSSLHNQYLPDRRDK
ncbi:hypothetical protein [Nostoc sp. GT001]|uniref:hypothetical protein n=1 Tax=Nostoc sp. GT001 TaxID=3056647 RepID=UPI00339C31AF